jgi:hypothetical protein
MKTSKPSRWVIEETQSGWMDGFYYDLNIALGMMRFYDDGLAGAFICREAEEDEVLPDNRLLCRLIQHPVMTLQ